MGCGCGGARKSPTETSGGESRGVESDVAARIRETARNVAAASGGTPSAGNPE